MKSAQTGDWIDVGKSVVARLLAEFVRETTGETPLCFDADPVNASFEAVSTFGAKKIDLLDNEQKVDASRFDSMMMKIVHEDRSVVIDSGASSYLALFGYLEENHTIGLLKDRGLDVYLHTIITGGAAIDFTTKNFLDVAERFGDEANIVAWLNHSWEPVERDEKPIHRMAGVQIAEPPRSFDPRNSAHVGRYVWTRLFRDAQGECLVRPSAVW